MSALQRFWVRLRRLVRPALRGVGEKRRERRGPVNLTRPLLALGTFAALALLVTPGQLWRKPRLVVGSIAKRDIVAPYKFAVEKDRGALRREQDEAARRVIPVFRRDDTAAGIAQDELRDFCAILRQLADTYALKEERERQVFLDELTINLSRPTLVYLLETKDLDVVRARAGEFVAVVMQEGILNPGELERYNLGKTITLMGGAEEGEKVVSTDEVWAPATAARRARALAARDAELSPVQVDAVAEVAALSLRPSLTFDQAETERRRRAARDAVDPVERWVSENERIVERNKTVTASGLRAVNALYSGRTLRNLGGSFGGRSLLVAVLLTALGLFFFRYRPAWRNELRYWWMLSLVLVGSTLVSRLLGGILGTYAPWSAYVFATALGAMFITVLADVELGYAVAIVLAVLSGVMGGVALRPALVALAAAGTAVFAIARLRRRSDFYTVFALAAGAATVTNVGIGLIDMTPWPTTGAEVIWGAVFTAASVVILAALLPVFEMTFHVVTDLRLLELADLNQILLRKLFLEAPGTYHHSVVVGTLAESAAAAVGANPLLARVASYYHDIGKVRAPGYFAENVGREDGRHENLSPQMSTLVVSSHTKQGAKMAEEAGLPPAIVEVIAEHHGTSLISFFYQEALKLDGHKVLAEDDFRYPGPKPHSTVSAIVMLADAVESASRSLEQPTPTHIRATVEKIVAARLADGQLDESELSLRELGIVRECFIKALNSVYHIRPTYPVSDARLVIPYLSAHPTETKSN